MSGKLSHTPSLCILRNISKCTNHEGYYFYFYYYFYYYYYYYCCSHIPRCLERCAQIAWQFRLSEILGLSFPLRAVTRKTYGGNTAGMSHWSMCLVHLKKCIQINAVLLTPLNSSTCKILTKVCISATSNWKSYNNDNVMHLYLCGTFQQFCVQEWRVL